MYGGICNENAPKFRKTKVVEVMMAINPDTGPDDPVDTPDRPGPADRDYAAVEPDVEEVAELGSLLSSDVAAKLMSDGHAPPSGWRRDDFPPVGPVVRRIVRISTMEFAPS